MDKLKLLNSIFPPVAVLAIAMTPTVVHFTVPIPPGPDKVFTKYATQALEEFGGSNFYNVEGEIKGICSIPRESGSGNYKKIADYLKGRVENILGDDLDGAVKIYQNKYGDDEEGDLIFDVKASQGCENWQPIILQDHMDMVLDGTAAAKEEARRVGIVPFVDGHTMYAANHQTSLGADNGMGIAVMLTALKNRNDFKHGPIRVICTSDEETTTGGAKIIDKEKDVLFLKNGKRINYMINIDAEPRFGIYRSCAGLFDISFKLENDTAVKFDAIDITPKWNTFDLWIGNLNGGHSAWDMENYRANADRLAFEYLNEFNNTYGGNHIELVSYDHTGTEPKSNQIVKNGHLVFATDKSIEDIEKVKADIINNRWTELYTGDDFKNKVQFSFSPTMTTSKCLDAAKSGEIIKFLGSNQKPSLASEDLEKGLFYGILDWTKGEGRRPAASTNIGPVKIVTGMEENDPKVYFTFVSKTRLVEQQYIKQISEAYQRAWTNIVGTPEPKRDNEMLPWVHRPDNMLLDWMEQAYTSLGVTPQPIDTRGGVEPALWTQYNKELYVICIGPEIQNAHSTSETCYLDTVDPCIKALMNVLSRMGEV